MPRNLMRIAFISMQTEPSSQSEFTEQAVTEVSIKSDYHRDDDVTSCNFVLDI